MQFFFLEDVFSFSDFNLVDFNHHLIMQSLYSYYFNIVLGGVFCRIKSKGGWGGLMLLQIWVGGGAERHSHLSGRGWGGGLLI